MSITTSHPIDLLSALPVPSPLRTLPPVPSGCWYVLRRWSALVGVPAALASRAALGNRAAREAEGEAWEVVLVAVRERGLAGLRAGFGLEGRAGVLTGRDGRRDGRA